jgi:SEC-C motif-containing protein
LPYRACCGPYTRGEAEAPDAEALMRSRFSAFALKDPAYLWKTLHPDHADRARPKEEFIKSIKRSGASLRYMRLSVLDRDGPDEEGTARVLFVAEVFEKGRDLSFMELSRFQRDEEGWRYLDGQLAPAAGLKVEGMSIEAFERALSRGGPKG